MGPRSLVPFESFLVVPGWLLLQVVLEKKGGQALSVRDASSSAIDLPQNSLKSCLLSRLFIVRVIFFSCRWLSCAILRRNQLSDLEAELGVEPGEEDRVLEVFWAKRSLLAESPKGVLLQTPIGEGHHRIDVYFVRGFIWGESQWNKQVVFAAVAEIKLEVLQLLPWLE